MTLVDESTIAVSEKADVVLAGRRTRALLGDAELDESTIEEIVLVVHELASNIVKHAGDGSITLEQRSSGDRRGIEVHAHDSGPGMANVDEAIVDGYSTAGSLGGGLGTIHRLMDDVDIHSDGSPDAGVEITAIRWDEVSSAGPTEPPLAVGAATRPRAGGDQNGDAYLVEHGDGQTLVGVIDGLGHGRAASEASSRARQYVETHSTQSLSGLFAGVERACQDTRGVVMVLARFDWAAATVTLGSVGNVTLRVCRSPESRHLVPKRGVLGADAPSPVIHEWDWNPTAVIVIHSDGLTSSWSCDEFALNDDRPVTDAADELLRTLSTRDDDATVLVVGSGGR